MKLEKKLRINDFSRPKVRDSPFVLKAESSELIFDKETLKKYGIKPSENLKGKFLRVMLSSRKVKKGKRALTDLTKNDILIKNVNRINRQVRAGIPFLDLSYTWNELVYSAYFETFHSGGGIYAIPVPFYKLNLNLNEEEYTKLRKLPADTVMKFSCRIVD